MILDKQLELSNAQAVTGTVVSTNVIDSGTIKPGLGAGNPMAIFLSIGAVTLANAITTVTVQTDSADTFGTPATVTTFSLAIADIVAGNQFYIPLPPNYLTERYLRLSYAASTSNFLCDAGLIPQDHQNKYVAFPSAVTIA